MTYSPEERDSPTGVPFFCHLHVHSEFSLLDGLATVDELASTAKLLNMPGIALTDHGSMAGSVKFYKACLAAGVKPVLGYEAYMTPSLNKRGDRTRYHLTLLARNNQGYENLMQLATIAQLGGFYYHGRNNGDSSSHENSIVGRDDVPVGVCSHER